MEQFIAEHWISLVFGLISAGVIAYCKVLHGKIKSYKKIIEDSKTERINDMIDAHLQPIKDELVVTKAKFEAIKESYKYRMICLCEQYLDRGYLTPKEYSAISEMWKVYHGLGGNSQAEDYYHKVEKLPVMDHHEAKN